MMTVPQILTLAATYCEAPDCRWQEALDAVAKEPGVTPLAMQQARRAATFWRTISGINDNGHAALKNAAKATRAKPALDDLTLPIQPAWPPKAVTNPA